MDIPQKCESYGVWLFVALWPTGLLYRYRQTFYPEKIIKALKTGKVAITTTARAKPRSAASIGIYRLPWLCTLRESVQLYRSSHPMKVLANKKLYE